ncbi:MAG: tryptophan-rich sensory protein [Paludibacter sp.]|nr:tryptophan-rich sensory protein [Paludibacter sp.]
MKSLIVKIIICASLCVALGTASGFSTIDSITNWYQFLNKPTFNPPNWIFGPVWTLLYLLMGIAVALIWHTPHPDKKRALQLFVAQFVLNLAWSYIFFNLHELGLAFVEIITLLIVIIFTIVAFYKINRKAAFLMIPYLCWVSFASVLNFSIWFLNRG